MDMKGTGKILEGSLEEGEEEDGEGWEHYGARGPVAMLTTLLLPQELLEQSKFPEA